MQIDEKKYKLKITFKNVLKIFELIKENRIEECLEILGINDLETEEQEIVLNEIAGYIFDVSNNSNHSKKTFDLNLDYKYYFVDFLKYGINLNKQDIDWWEFDTILEAIFLDSKSIINKVMEYRLYERPPKNVKTQGEKRHRFMLKMKQKYSLPLEENLETSLEKLWNYVEKRAGDKKE